MPRSAPVRGSISELITRQAVDKAPNYRYSHLRRVNASYSGSLFREIITFGPTGPKEIDKLIKVLQLQKELLAEDNLGSDKDDGK
jgi:hypothetical protein